MKVYKAIAITIQSINNCIKNGNTEWQEKHETTLSELMSGAPNGSGFDSGTELLEESTENKLIFKTAFHHMNEHGYYTAWTHHKVIITPNLASEFDMKITGRDKNQIKDYISDMFTHWLYFE